MDPVLGQNPSVCVLGGMLDRPTIVELPMDKQVWGWLITSDRDYPLIVCFSEEVAYKIIDKLEQSGFQAGERERAEELGRAVPNYRCHQVSVSALSELAKEITHNGDRVFVPPTKIVPGGADGCKEGDPT